VELSSEADLFFHYAHSVDERSFRAMRDEQRLMVRHPHGPVFPGTLINCLLLQVDFREYAKILSDSFTQAVKVRLIISCCSALLVVN
jgi:hypothetical protein